MVRFDEHPRVCDEAEHDPVVGRVEIGRGEAGSEEAVVVEVDARTEEKGKKKKTQGSEINRRESTLTRLCSPRDSRAVTRWNCC